MNDRELELSRPWTGGPWKIINRGIDGWVEAPPGTGDYGPKSKKWIVGGEHCEGFVDQSDPNIQLIALAPEMAEAILAWDNDPGGSGGCEPLSVLAEKLRSIR